ncbi:MAG: 2-C-methyl-D-erythritol 4-phosphate cytidylyltransferase [Candidatus Midichloria sp.]|uniref:2-C-methyl-D-erythritol 4-phosphate cytidylyltransferase n=1 Tax=Hyalomma marginatum TaxID=34627 RepID=A0A8S4C240_9ACAR|nr:2-C-methyl-D-erythritol 4-phosphate cytidylyltransferase [Hyalomma marginatum]CAG7591363.1 2-C-methyl-D-erythritol 4-phosphate cytidylyltransferase [Hyalomma marginatum]
MSKTIALIVASGHSSRFANSSLTKVYQKIKGKEVLYHVLKKFADHYLVDEVCVVVKPEHEKYYQPIINEFRSIKVTFGGTTRQESVKNGLDFIVKFEPQNVIIHDAARPFVSKRLITDIILALRTSDAVDVLLPIVDTLKRFDENNNLVVVPRDGLYQTQTPQGFKFKVIYELHHDVTQNVTDDISLSIEKGLIVSYVKGEASNYKITFKEDI